MSRINQEYDFKWLKDLIANQSENKDDFVYDFVKVKNGIVTWNMYNDLFEKFFRDGVTYEEFKVQSKILNKTKATEEEEEKVKYLNESHTYIDKSSGKTRSIPDSFILFISDTHLETVSMKLDEFAYSHPDFFNAIESGFFNYFREDLSECKNFYSEQKRSRSFK